MGVEVKFTFDDQEVSGDKLQALVDNQILLGTIDHLIQAINEEMGDVLCPEHHQPPQVIIAISSSGAFSMETTTCCPMFDKTATGPLLRALNQTAYFTPDMKLIIQVEGSPHPLMFDVGNIETLVIGRSDAQAPEKLDVDLRAYGAADKGVSRRHAALVWQGGALHIVDKDSANGTYLNEQRLVPHWPSILHDGDTIRLGALVLRIQLADAQP